MELATGSFPYPKWNSVFEQLTQVVQGDPPRLTNSENGNTFTLEFVDFVNTWSVLYVLTNLIILMLPIIYRWYSSDFLVLNPKGQRMDNWLVSYLTICLSLVEAAGTDPNTFKDGILGQSMEPLFGH